MKNDTKSRFLFWNSILWAFAMVVPAIFSIALTSAKFHWQTVVPLLLIGPMLASNKMIVQAMGETSGATGESTPKRPNA